MEYPNISSQCNECPTSCDAGQYIWLSLQPRPGLSFPDCVLFQASAVPLRRPRGSLLVRLRRRHHSRDGLFRDSYHTRSPCFLCEETLLIFVEMGGVEPRKSKD